MIILEAPFGPESWLNLARVVFSIVLRLGATMFHGSCLRERPPSSLKPFLHQMGSQSPNKRKAPSAQDRLLEGSLSKKDRRLRVKPSCADGLPPPPPQNGSTRTPSCFDPVAPKRRELSKRQTPFRTPRLQHVIGVSHRLPQLDPVEKQGPRLSGTLTAHRAPRGKKRWGTTDFLGRPAAFWTICS